MGLLLERTFTPKIWVCARHGDHAPQIEHPGFNYYAQLRTELSVKALPDPRPALEDNLTPSIVLASECDYVPWEVIRQYRQTLLNEKVFYFEDAGHAIHLTRPEQMASVIRAFLHDQPFPVASYTHVENPRPLLTP
jgi:pimeloyl-ACP methyl ester carboxylesterase